MASAYKKTDNAAEIDRLALALAKEPGSKVFIPLAEEYGKAGMWDEAAAVLEDGLKSYPHFITAMVALGRTYEQLNQPVKAKAILEEAIKVSPDNLRAHRILARLYAAQGAKDATMRSCNVILAINQHDQEALSLRSAVTRTSLEAAGQSEKLSASASRPDCVPLCRESQSVPSSDEGARIHTSAGFRTTVSSPQTQPVSTGRVSVSVSKQRHAASVATLEQWLNRIQTRRRDRVEATHRSV